MLSSLRKELDLLQKLYGLYDAVMSKINGYYSILWTQVDIEKINAELLEFQNRLGLSVILTYWVKIYCVMGFFFFFATLVIDIMFIIHFVGVGSSPKH